MNYSYETTVLLWANDKLIKEMLEKVCKSLKLAIWSLNVPEDLFGVPYFFAVIDGKYLTKQLINNLEETLKYANPKEFSILLTCSPDIKIPPSIKKYFIQPIEVINLDWLKTNIFNKRFAILRHKNNNKSYDKTIFRIIYILRSLMKKDCILRLDDLCREFNVSEKTIKRDFALLNSMGEDIRYDRNRKGYFMQNSLLEMLIED